MTTLRRRLRRQLQRLLRASGDAVSSWAEAFDEPDAEPDALPPRPARLADAPEHWYRLVAEHAPGLIADRDAEALVDESTPSTSEVVAPSAELARAHEPTAGSGDRPTAQVRPDDHVPEESTAPATRPAPSIPLTGRPPVQPPAPDDSQVPIAPAPDRTVDRSSTSRRLGPAAPAAVRARPPRVQPASEREREPSSREDVVEIPSPPRRRIVPVTTRASGPAAHVVDPATPVATAQVDRPRAWLADPPAPSAVPARTPRPELLADSPSVGASPTVTLARDPVADVGAGVGAAAWPGIPSTGRPGVAAGGSTPRNRTSELLAAWRDELDEAQEELGWTASCSS